MNRILNLKMSTKRNQYTQMKKSCNINIRDNSDCGNKEIDNSSNKESRDRKREIGCLLKWIMITLLFTFGPKLKEDTTLIKILVPI